MSNNVNHLDYTNNVLNAIDILVDRAISKAGYDQTIPAIVMECVDGNKGLYRVKYQDAIYTATTDNPSIVYPNGSLVYVLIPGNDFSREKKITGAIKNSGQLVKSSDLEKEEYKLLGASCIALKEELSYCSYRGFYEDVLYDADAQNNRIIVDEESLKMYLKETGFIQIGGAFKSKVNTRQKQGRYEIVVDIDFKDEQSGQESTKEFCLASNGMDGAPLTFINFVKRDVVFEIEKEDYQRIKRIRFLMQDFNSDDDILSPDIWIKDLSLTAVQSNEGVYKQPYALNLLTPNGIVFKKEIDDKGNESFPDLTIQAEFLKNGNKIIDESNISFYWFKANSSITNTSPKYSSHAGVGWECLNEFNTIQKDGQESIYWLKGKSTFTISKKDATTEQTYFKCVAIYEPDEDGIAKNEFTIMQPYPEYSIQIETTNGKDFSQDKGFTDLTCKIQGSDIPEDKITYYWSEESHAKADVVENNLSKTPLVEGMLNAEIQERVGQFVKNISTQMKEEGSTEKVDIKAIASELKTDTLTDEEVAGKLSALFGITENTTYEELKTQTEDYMAKNPIPRKEANSLFGVLAASINGSKTYKCTAVDDKGDVLGTAVLTVTNRIIKGVGGGVTLENGNQVFKYSMGGVAPNHASATYPQTIQPLSFKIYNEKGELLTAEQVKNSCSAIWYIPAENTMLVAPEGARLVNDTYQVSENTLAFNIKERFDVTAINNNIRLEVKYGEKIFQEITSLSFIKDGDLGTNGTEFYCRVVPNEKNSKGLFSDYVSYTYRTYSNQESWNFDLDTTKNEHENITWFKSILYKNGSIVEDNNIQTFWKILKNNSSNESYFSIAANPGVDITIDQVTQEPKEDKDKIDNYHGVVTERAGFTRTSHQINTLSNPYNILQATVIYDEKEYFGIVPICTIALNTSQYEVCMKPRSGFTFVQYSSDGYNPQYPANNPFEIEIKDRLGNIVTDLKDFTFEWGVVGKDNQIKPNNEKCHFIPAERYSGEALNVAITCQIKTSLQPIASIHFPIYFTLNRYEHEFLNKWNGNGITLNEEDGVILTPQIIAGRKHDVDNTFTGVLMGDVKFSKAEKEEDQNKIGLMGFHKGRQTFHLNSETGDAFFGANGEVNFTFSKDEKGILHSDIRLGPWNVTEQSIYKGEECVGGSAQQYLDDQVARGRTEEEIVNDPEYQARRKDSENTIYLGVQGFSLGHDLVYKTPFDKDEDGVIDDEEQIENALTIRGTIYANKGKIGPWYIDEDSFGYDHYNVKFGDVDSRFYLGREGISIKDGFKVYVNDESNKVETTILLGKIGQLLSLNDDTEIVLGKRDLNYSNLVLKTDNLNFNAYGIPQGEVTDTEEGETEEESSNTEGDSGEGGVEEEDTRTDYVNTFSVDINSSSMSFKKYSIDKNELEPYFVIDGSKKTVDFTNGKLLLSSPNGTVYELKVGNDGKLSTAVVSGVGE